MRWMWLAAVVLASGSAHADIAEPWVQVECTLRPGVDAIDRCGINDNCIFAVQRARGVDGRFVLDERRTGDNHVFSLHAPRPENRGSEYGQLWFHDYDDAGLEQEVEPFLDAVAQFCTEDIVSLREAFRPAVEQWRGEGTGKVGRRTASEILYFEPWREEIERSGERVLSERVTCEYGERARHGDWLRVTERTCFHEPDLNDVVLDLSDGSPGWWRELLIGGGAFLGAAVTVLIIVLARRRRRR